MADVSVQLAAMKVNINEISLARQKTQKPNKYDHNRKQCRSPEKRNSAS